MGKRKTVSKAPQTAPPNRAAAFLSAHAYWLFPFGLFLVLRLFSGDPYFLLGGDQCTFLELGRTFPKHELFNHELYLIHSPPFGYAIGILHLVLPLLASGLLAVLLFAGINFFAIRALARFEQIPKAAISVGLFYLAISRPAVTFDYHVARVSILVCAGALALLAFLRLLANPSRKTLILAIAANTFALLVSDQALLLLPCEAVLFLARGPRREWKLPCLLGMASVVAAAAWPLVRLIEFRSRTDLPAGISGTVEFTSGFPWLALIQPNFLPFTNTHRSLFTQTSLSLKNLRPALLGGLPTDLLLIPGWISVVLVVLLIGAALAQSTRRWRSVQWLALSVLFLLPVGMGMNDWYSMGFVVPFALLLMEGAAACLGWAGSSWKNSDQVFSVGFSAACVLASALWLAAPATDAPDLLSPGGGTHFLFTRPPLTRAFAISRIFDSLPRDAGIMAPTGLSPEVVYLTDKRVIALPFDPGLLDRFIDEYHISYLLISNEFFRRYDSPVADRYTSSAVVGFIFQHPERYRLIKSLREEYPAFYPSLEYYVFQTDKGPAR